MFRWYANEFKYNLGDKLDVSEIIDIFTSEDMENTPLESRMWFRMNFMSGVFSSKMLVWLYNKYILLDVLVCSIAVYFYVLKEGECDSFAGAHRPVRQTGFLLYKYGKQVFYLALINRSREYRPNAVRSVHTTEVKILPYRPT